MSQAAILKAVRAKLQTTFGLTDDSCEMCFDGQPSNPVAGEFYIAVHPLSWTSVSGDYDLGEEFQIGVTLTMRTSFAAKDRRGIAVWLAADDGMESRLRMAITAIHQNQDVRIAANAFITEGGGKIMTPLWLLNIAPPRIQNWDWFGAAAPESEDAEAVCGVSQTLTFGKCQRVQNIEYME